MKDIKSLGGSGQKPGCSGPTKRIDPKKGGSKTTKGSASTAYESKGAK